jgi:hypothetical protein
MMAEGNLDDGGVVGWHMNGMAWPKEGKNRECYFGSRESRDYRRCLQLPSLKVVLCCVVIIVIIVAVY